MSRIPPSIPSFSETGLIHFDLSFLEEILSGPVIIYSYLHDDDMPDHFLSFPDISKAIDYFYFTKNCSHVPVIQISSSSKFSRAVEILVDGHLLSFCLDQGCACDPYLKAYSDNSEDLPVAEPAADDFSHVDVMDPMDCPSPDYDVEPKGNVDTDLKDLGLIASSSEMPPASDSSELEMSSIEEYPDEFPDAVMGDEPDEKPKSLKKFISRFRK